MRPSVWIQCLERTDCVQAVASALTTAGIEIRALVDQPGLGPGILVFDSANQELFDRLRWLSRAGKERLIALAVRSSLLADDSVWRMLEAGASEVLSWDNGCDATTQHVVARLKRWTDAQRRLRAPRPRS